ncbi:MAG: hypothetical protein AAFX94_10250 [Myxococcota bacterium]
MTVHRASLSDATPLAGHPETVDLWGERCAVPSEAEFRQAIVRELMHGYGEKFDRGTAEKIAAKAVLGDEIHVSGFGLKKPYYAMGVLPFQVRLDPSKPKSVSEWCMRFYERKGAVTISTVRSKAPPAAPTRDGYLRKDRGVVEVDDKEREPGTREAVMQSVARELRGYGVELRTGLQSVGGADEYGPYVQIGRRVDTDAIPGVADHELTHAVSAPMHAAISACLGPLGARMIEAHADAGSGFMAGVRGSGVQPLKGYLSRISGPGVSPTHGSVADRKSYIDAGYEMGVAMVKMNPLLRYWIK